MKKQILLTTLFLFTSFSVFASLTILDNNKVKFLENNIVYENELQLCYTFSNNINFCLNSSYNSPSLLNTTKFLNQSTNLKMGFGYTTKFKSIFISYLLELGVSIYPQDYYTLNHNLKFLFFTNYKKLIYGLGFSLGKESIYQKYSLFLSLGVRV